MPPTPKSKTFAKLSAAERARRIRGIDDPRKRAAAARFWDVDLGGRDWHPVKSARYAPSQPRREAGNFLERAIEDVPKIYHGAVKEGKEVGRAIAADAVKGRGLPGLAYASTPLTWGLGALDVIPDPKTPFAYKKLPKAEQRGALDRWSEKTVKGYPGQLKMLADPIAWYNDPLIQVANLGSVVIPGLRVASVAKLAKGFKQANPGMTRAQANKAGLVESLNPGLMRAHGVEGGLKPRKIVGKYGQAGGRMPSRSPLGRGGQRAWDRAQEAIDRRDPNLPFSASRVGAAASRRAATRVQRRTDAERKQLLDEVTRAITPTRRQRAATALGLAGRTDPAVAAALVASLEGPNGLSVEAATNLRIAAKEKILDEDTELRGKQDAIDTLQRQRDETEIEDPEADLGELDAEISRQTDALDFDLARRIPEVTGSKSRDSLYAAMVKTVGKEKARQVIAPYDAVARTRNPENPGQWYDETFEGARTAKAEGWTPEAEALYRREDYKPMPDADTHERIRNYYAHGFSRTDKSELAATLVDEDEAAYPGSWAEMKFDRNDALSEYYHEIDRFDEQNPGALYRRGEQGAPTAERMSTRGFYFPLQQALEGMDPNASMQAGQLLKRLEKEGISPEELRNSELGAVLAEDKNAKVTPGGILEYLDEQGYFVDFDPLVIINRSDDALYGTREFATNWGPETHPQLNSREGLPGEYHEMMVSFPGFRGGQIHNRARSHWQNADVVYHIRYQIFDDEDGNTVLLVDEIQSDAASDYRDAKKQGTQQVSQEELDAERVVLEDAVQRTAEAESDAMAAFAEARDAYYADIKENGPIGRSPDVEVQEARRAELKQLEQRMTLLSDELTDYVDQARDAHTQLEDFKRWSPRRVPPSPMGPDRYVKNAVRQLIREADDNDVDVIIIADGTTQALRNGTVDLGVDHNVTIQAEPYERWGEYMWNYEGKRPGEPLTNEEIREILWSGEEHLGSFPRQYNLAIPEHFQKILGQKAQHMMDAYTGRYSAQSTDWGSEVEGYVQRDDSGMPGTVFKLSEEAMERARASQPMYRRNTEGVAQGATEFLADGRARLTMFETANVSTWVHELAHVAVRDLDPADQATVSKHLAEGRPFADWTEADQEAYARSFETYLRTGKAHPALQEIFAKLTAWMKKLWHEVGPEGEQIAPEVADSFDRLLGRRYQNTVLLDRNQRAQVEAEIADLKKALESPDSLDDAADALARLAEHAEEAGIQILRRGWKSPEQEAAGMEGLARRKNAVVEDYRRRGLIGPGEEARGYFPNMSMWEALGQPQAEASRVAATGSVIGTPRVTSKAVNKNRNRLVRYQTGEVLNDPTAVLYILRARQRILQTIRAREELYAVGEPVEAAMASPGWDPDQYALVRNPDVAPEKMRNATEAMAALSRADFTRLQKRRAVEDADELDTSDLAEEMIWIPGQGKPKPDWVHSEANVRAVPMKVAKNRVGDVFTGKPRGQIAAVFGMANALARAASIYLPLGGARYVARNWIQNAVLLAVTNPTGFQHLIGDNGRKLRKEDPTLYHMINEEFGTIQAQALPEFNTRPQGRMQRAERDLNRISGQTGEHLGRFADVPLRMASWRRHADKYGFTSREDYRRLLEDPELEEIRNTISQRTREDMIDFDSLTPFEKEVLSRYLFIWPFIRGATKWPFMFAREYPGRLAAASLFSNAINQEDQSGSISEQLRGAVGKRLFDFAWMNPAGPALENAQRLDEFVKRNARGEITLKPLVTESLAPQYRFLLDALTGDLGNDPGQKLASTFMPFFTSAEAAMSLDEFKEFVLKTFGNQTDSRSIKKEAAEWSGEMDAAIAWVEKEKGVKLKPAVKAKLERMKGAYGDWTSLSKRAEWAGAERAEDSLSPQKRASLALEVLVEHYPELYAQAERESRANTGMSPEEFIATLEDEEKLDKIYQAIRQQMFGAKEEVMRSAKEAGYKA